MCKSIVVLLLAIYYVPAFGGEPDWQPVVTELLRSEKTGFGGLCGVVVDHESGEIWINLSDRGMFHSTNQGASWKSCSATQPKGRTETPGCWLLDPTGKSRTMVTALVYGSPVAVSADQAANWRYLANQSTHSDWCAVDWTDPELKFVLALKHEAGGLLLVSTNGGKSFSEVGKGYGTGWIFDAQTAVVAEAKSKDRPKPNLMRTTDGGKSFQPCGAYSPVGTNSAQALPKWREGVLFWLVGGGLIATMDKGKTWKQIAKLNDTLYGPVFGRDVKHMFILTKAGVIESTDGGVTWSSPLVPPKEMKGIAGLSWLAYDSKNDILYLMKMGSDLYRLARGK